MLNRHYQKTLLKLWDSHYFFLFCFFFLVFCFSVFLGFLWLWIIICRKTKTCLIMAHIHCQNNPYTQTANRFSISKRKIKNRYLFVLKIYSLKVASATFLLICFSSLKESNYETWKNVFYFTSKALFFLKKTKS